MARNTFSWDEDDDIQEMRRMERQFEQDMAIQAAQQQALAQSQQAAQQQQGLSGNIQVNGLGEIIGGSGSAGTFYGIGQSSYSYQFNPYRFTPPPPRPFAQAEDFSYGLQQLDPTAIKELVIQEPMYNQFLGMMALDAEKNPEYKKQLTYHLPLGKILIKNEKYQFDLDKYMEDAPVKL